MDISINSNHYDDNENDNGIDDDNNVSDDDVTGNDSMKW